MLKTDEDSTKGSYYRKKHHLSLKEKIIIMRHTWANLGFDLWCVLVYRLTTQQNIHLWIGCCMWHALIVLPVEPSWNEPTFLYSYYFTLPPSRRNSYCFGSDKVPKIYFWPVIYVRVYFRKSYKTIYFKSTCGREIVHWVFVY